MARAGLRFGTLIALMALVPSRALALEVVVRAEVSADLREIHGTLRVTASPGETAPTLIDPLAALPMPRNDRERLRRYPRAVAQGSVRWTADEDATLRFTTTLPERFGDVGWLPREGLRANGGWYPTPVDVDGKPLVADWDVEVRAADAGLTVVLNDGGSCTKGQGSGACEAWRGRADHVALAVLPFSPRAGGSGGSWGSSPAAGDPGDTGAWWTTGAGLEPRRTEGGVGSVMHAVRTRLSEVDTSVIFVRTHDPERLVHVGPGVVYLSDRAFRVWPRALERWHRVAVERAVIAAACRSCAGSREAMVLATLRTASPRVVRHSLPLGLGVLVDMAMPDPGIPAWAEMYDRPWRAAPDLCEALDGGVPASAIAGQVRALGADVATRLDATLAAGMPLEEAAAAAGVPDDVIAHWSSRVPDTVNLVATVSEHGAVVTRAAVDDAGLDAAIVPLEVDGEDTAWVAGSGDARHELPGASRVRVDPNGTLPELDRGDNNLPRVWGGRAGGGISAISVTGRTFDASFSALLRHREDTRRAWILAGSHDAQDLLTLQAGRLFQLGRLVRPREREWRFTPWLAASALDKDFTGGPSSALSVVPDIGFPLAGSVGLSLVRDTMEDPFFPLDGSRVALTASAGGILTNGAVDGGWAGTNLTLVRVRALNVHHAFAGRVRGGWVGGDTAQRLLPLGGSLDVRAIPEPAAVGNARFSAATEYRARPWSRVAVPLGIGWLTELHLSPGVEAGFVATPAGSVSAKGVTLGGHGTLELAGLLPASGGVTLAWPVWTENLEPSGLQVYADVMHAF